MCKISNLRIWFASTFFCIFLHNVARDYKHNCYCNKQNPLPWLYLVTATRILVIDEASNSQHEIISVHYSKCRRSIIIFQAGWFKDILRRYIPHGNYFIHLYSVQSCLVSWFLMRQWSLWISIQSARPNKSFLCVCNIYMSETPLYSLDTHAHLLALNPGERRAWNASVLLHLHQPSAAASLLQGSTTALKRNGLLYHVVPVAVCNGASY